MAAPKNFPLYRITHIENIRFIAKVKKLTCPTNKANDKNYIGIGDSSLIKNRGSKKIELDPFGTFLDYISFYFGPRSPMLYEIEKGYNGVQSRPMEDIVYLVTDFEQIKKAKVQYVFFDGHGYHGFSTCYNQEKHLNEVPWNDVNAKYWLDTEEDPDKKRRKQAELLVYDELSIEAVTKIGVYNNAARERVMAELKKAKLDIQVQIFREGYY